MAVEETVHVGRIKKKKDDALRGGEARLMKGWDTS